MISGLSEEEIPDDDGTNLVDDETKLESLLHKIGINDIDDKIGDFVFTRIGAANERKKRLLKVNVGSKELRDKICLETWCSLHHGNPYTSIKTCIRFILRKIKESERRCKS